MGRNYTLTVAVEKGGTGKSTVVWSLGEWMHRAGRKVLYVDLDAQGNLSALLKTDTSKPTIYDVLMGKARANRAIQSTAQGDIIQSSPSMSNLGTALTGMGREYRLKEALEGLTDRYDIVLIDTPPRIGVETLSALTASDGILIPMNADILAFQGLESVIGSVQEVQRYTNPKLEILGILITERPTSRPVSMVRRSGAESRYRRPRPPRRDYSSTRRNRTRPGIWTRSPRSWTNR